MSARCMDCGGPTKVEGEECRKCHPPMAKPRARVRRLPHVCHVCWTRLSAGAHRHCHICFAALSPAQRRYLAALSPDAIETSADLARALSEAT